MIFFFYRSIFTAVFARNEFFLTSTPFPGTLFGQFRRGLFQNKCVKKIDIIEGSKVAKTHFGKKTAVKKDLYIFILFRFFFLIFFNKSDKSIFWGGVLLKDFISQGEHPLKQLFLPDSSICFLNCISTLGNGTTVSFD